MAKLRTKRINSLLREVLADVIARDVKNPHVHMLTTVMKVEVSDDLYQAKVFVSIFGTPEERSQTLTALRSAAGFIAVTASRELSLRHFPELIFYLDETIERQLHIEGLLKEIHEKRDQASQASSESEQDAKEL